ncbi:MAG: hypothetical protein ACR2QT_05990 [Woeseiaceae bacterium]
MKSLQIQAIVILFTTLAFAPDSMADDQRFENAVDLNAADILPAELLKGAHYELDGRVRNDGYLNYYTIQSDHGEFEAVGNAMLRTRIREIGALAELDEFSKTEVFAKAAVDAGVKQLKTVQDFATKPVETVKGIPKGIGSMFRRYSRQASEAVDASKEFIAGDDKEDGEEESDQDGEKESTTDAAVDLTEGYMGVDKAQRNWARKLGTDPYSSNTVLQSAIKELAWAERLGKFGMGFAGIPKIPGADIIGDVNEAVWGKDPYELRDLNQSRLLATGADEELIEQYLDNSRLTPSQTTLLTAAIAELEGVNGRDGILRQSLNPETEAEIEFFIKSVTILAWYHLNQNSIAEVDSNAAIPSATLETGTQVLAFATDHVYWTDTIAQAATQYAGLGGEDQAREIWLLGTVSDQCAEELGGLGFDVHVEFASMMLQDTK